MKDPLKVLEPNLLGRDFAIGDLHGCYDLFQNLLKNINFDPAIDRMISVGDLIDRGPDHLKCLELLREPWFHAALGNHEQMMLDTLHWPGAGSMWFNNGGEWGMEAVNDRRSSSRIPSDHSVALFDLLPLVKELPYLITVNVKSGKKFHVIHAELPVTPVPLSDEILSDSDNVLKIATIQCYEGDSITWHRCLFNELYERDLTNRDKIVRVVKYNDMTDTMFNDELSHIICGHTTLHRPITLVGQTCIDTGAWQSRWSHTGGYSSHGVAPKKWAGLTCIELDTWKFYQATETTFKEIEPFVVNKVDLSD